MPDVRPLQPMTSRHSILIAAAPLVLLLSCARQTAAHDPLARALRSLEPASISAVAVSGASEADRPLSVAADQWPSLLGLLQTLEPAPEVPAFSPSSPAAADWQALGSVFVTLSSPAGALPPRPAPFFRVNVARHSRSHAVVAFVYSSRDQLFLAYRGQPLSAWLHAHLRGA